MALNIIKTWQEMWTWIILEKRQSAHACQTSEPLTDNHIACTATIRLHTIKYSSVQKHVTSPTRTIIHINTKSQAWKNKTRNALHTDEQKRMYKGIPMQVELAQKLPQGASEMRGKRCETFLEKRRLELFLEWNREDEKTKHHIGGWIHEFSVERVFWNTYETPHTYHSRTQMNNTPPHSCQTYNTRKEN